MRVMDKEPAARVIKEVDIVHMFIETYLPYVDVDESGELVMTRNKTE
jgi:hypothetical protein